MGQRGPAPKPTRLKKLAGNPGKRPLNNSEPQPVEDIGTCPKWLSKEAKAEWRRILPELQRLHLATMMDRTALAAYCQAHAELVEATRILEAEGRLIQVPILSRRKVQGETVVEVVGQATKQHPAVRLQRDAFARVKQFLGEFGLTPSSRSRLHVSQESPKEEDSFEALLNAPLRDN